MKASELSKALAEIPSDCEILVDGKPASFVFEGGKVSLKPEKTTSKKKPSPKATDGDGSTSL